MRCLARHEVLGENYVGVVAQQLLDGSPEVRATSGPSLTEAFFCWDRLSSEVARRFLKVFKFS